MALSLSHQQVLTAEPFHTPFGQRTAGRQGQLQSLDIVSKAGRRDLGGRSQVTQAMGPKLGTSQSCTAREREHL